MQSVVQRVWVCAHCLSLLGAFDKTSSARNQNSRKYWDDFSRW